MHDRSATFAPIQIQDAGGSDREHQGEALRAVREHEHGSRPAPGATRVRRERKGQHPEGDLERMHGAGV